MSRADNRPQIDDPWEDLVVSVLSVNNYSLERTYKSITALREQGLVDPRRLEQWDQSEIASRLKAAGCDRGEFMTNLFALRLANVGELVRHKGVQHCTDVINSSNVQAIEKLLMPVNGIGPVVMKNFFFLRGG